MYTYSIIILKIARKINRNVDFPGFSKPSIRLSVNPHWKLRERYKRYSIAIFKAIYCAAAQEAN